MPLRPRPRLSDAEEAAIQTRPPTHLSGEDTPTRVPEKLEDNQTLAGRRRRTGVLLPPRPDLELNANELNANEHNANELNANEPYANELNANELNANELYANELPVALLSTQRRETDPVSSDVSRRAETASRSGLNLFRPAAAGPDAPGR